MNQWHLLQLIAAERESASGPVSILIETFSGDQIIEPEDDYGTDSITGWFCLQKGNTREIIDPEQIFKVLIKPKE